MEMKRKDLAVTDPARVDEIILSCDCCRLAFADGTHPYIIPLSFGYERKEETQCFYFHGAAVGRKVDLCRRLGYAGFELDRYRTVNPNEKACDFSMRYQSIVGEGEITELIDAKEKAQALQIIMKQLSGRDDWEFPENVLEKTCVFRLEVKELSAREHG
ncbi:MAG: pyridoxamine 5'-phosphate oxidase family protein [Clostridia bacterium]|nr:pyridoxamine 5'-phosphate oxidase family protein [Clostridia bacterium]